MDSKSKIISAADAAKEQIKSLLAKYNASIDSIGKSVAKKEIIEYFIEQRKLMLLSKDRLDYFVTGAVNDIEYN